MCLPLRFPPADPERERKECALREMSDEDLLALYNITREAASQARRSADMEALYPLARGMKTIQRVAGERGFIIRARNLQKKTSDI